MKATLIPILATVAFFCVLSIIVIVGQLEDKNKAKQDAARKLNPPAVEVDRLTDERAAFPVFVVHDRATGREWLVARSAKGQLLLLNERGEIAGPDRAWIMEGDEHYRRPMGIQLSPREEKQP